MISLLDLIFFLCYKRHSNLEKYNLDTQFFLIKSTII